jgi:DNA-binding transcriptional ArsR family regulator
VVLVAGLEHLLGVLTSAAISRHLKVLERAGLITRGRTAQSRPSSLRVEAFEEATMWMNARREMWEGRMDRLDRHLQQIQRGPDDE